jgi:hypothetical protein
MVTTMLGKLGTPLYMGLIAFIAFVVGFLALDAFRNRENFSQWNVPMTVADYAKMPKKLDNVKNYPMVTDHDFYYNRYGG